MNYGKWRADDDAHLLRAWRSGDDLETLADQYGRSRGAIRSRLIKLGIDRATIHNSGLADQSYSSPARCVGITARYLDEMTAADCGEYDVLEYVRDAMKERQRAERARLLKESR